jgi:cell division septum initiation protein DivIVA
MRFSWIALLVILVSAAANVVQALTGTQLPLLIGVNLGCLIALTVIAVRRYGGDVLGFDAVVAAETIVAFGVTSLIFSLVAALFPLLAAGQIDAVMQKGGLLRLAMPFLEGLATAGFAPLFAMFVRNFVSEHDAEADEVADTADLTKAIGSLTKQLNAARKAAAELEGPLNAATSATRTLAVNLVAENARLKAALIEAQDQMSAFGQAAKSGAGQMSGLAEETERLRCAAVEEAGRLRQAASDHVARLAGAADVESARLRTETDAQTARLRGAVEDETLRLTGAATRETERLIDATALETERLRAAVAQETARLKAAAALDTERLKRAAEETTVLLETLARLIASVERFVAPGARSGR